jgi:hypothetical protein
MQNSEEMEPTPSGIVTPTALTLWLATVIFALFALSIAIYLSPNASNAVAEAAQQEAGIALEQPVVDPDGALSLAAAYAKPNQGGEMGGKPTHDIKAGPKPPAQKIAEGGNPYP